jgi:hypothetical protein
MLTIVKKIRLTALVGLATLGYSCCDSARSFAALAKENADVEGNDFPPSTSLVGPCLLVESAFFKGRQLSSNVMVRARVLGAHRLCQWPLAGRLRPGGVPLRARKRGERRCWLPGDRASRR